MLKLFLSIVLVATCISSYAKADQQISQSKSHTGGHQTIVADGECCDADGCGICGSGSVCLQCPGQPHPLCYSSKNHPTNCTPTTQNFEFSVINKVIHLDSSRYSKYTCKPPLVMKVLSKRFIECVNPSDSKNQAPAK